MKVVLATLAIGVPTDFSHEYVPVKLELDAQDAEFLDPIQLNGTLEKFEEVLVVKGRLSSVRRETCARCLARNERSFVVDIDLKLVFKPTQKAYDFTNEVREEIILSDPMKFLCDENCKGLCGNCGANLNVADCECPKREVKDSPFNVLKKLKKDKD